VKKKEMLIKLLKTDFQKINEYIGETDFEKIKKQVNNLSTVEIDNMLNYTVYLHCTLGEKLKYCRTNRYRLNKKGE
jgi:hypothetical protein